MRREKGDSGFSNGSWNASGGRLSRFTCENGQIDIDINTPEVIYIYIFDVYVPGRAIQDSPTDLGTL